MDAVPPSERYRTLFELSGDAILMVDADGAIEAVNPAALELIGCARDELVGRPALSLCSDTDEREHLRRELAARGHVREHELRVVRSDGSERWCLVTAWACREPGRPTEGYQAILHDISVRKSAEEQLARQAFHDPLTALPNRALLMDRLERAVARRKRSLRRDLAVLFLDLDRFKVVNDSLGHSAGDELLRQLARTLEEQVRAGDTVARIGGDEFAILLDGIDDPGDPIRVAERIQDRLREPLTVQGHDVFTSFSIGITYGGDAGRGAEDLLRDADTAMYRAKELGPSRYQVYDERMRVHVQTSLQIESELRVALERDEFRLLYQPYHDLRDRRPLGFEALIRWHHPRRGVLPPRAFLSIAEETGLIVPIGEWVLRTATAQLRSWRQIDGAGHLVASVNLANRQLTDPGLVNLVRNVLRENELPGAALRFEIPERVLLRHPTTVLRTLRELRALGVALCLDGFGTAYSSLEHLQELPLDAIKIDRSFIRRLGEGDQGTHIVATIMALARLLGLDTVAEGVETERQLELLEGLGPGGVQGFFLSPPIAPDDARALLSAPRPDPAPRGS